MHGQAAGGAGTQALQAGGEIGRARLAQHRGGGQRRPSSTPTATSSGTARSTGGGGCRGAAKSPLGWSAEGRQMSGEPRTHRRRGRGRGRRAMPRSRAPPDGTPSRTWSAPARSSARQRRPCRGEQQRALLAGGEQRHSSTGRRSGDRGGLDCSCFDGFRPAAGAESPAGPAAVAPIFRAMAVVPYPIMGLLDERNRQ